MWKHSYSWGPPFEFGGRGARGAGSCELPWSFRRGLFQGSGCRVRHPFLTVLRRPGLWMVLDSPPPTSPLVRTSACVLSPKGWGLLGAASYTHLYLPGYLGGALSRAAGPVGPGTQRCGLLFAKST